MVLVRVNVVSIRCPKINMGVIMMPFGKVMIHHRAKSR